MKATYPIEELWMFRRFHTRAGYQTYTNQEPPPFNPNRRPKYWYDSSAGTTSLRNVQYAQTVALTDRGIPAVGPDGKPMLEPLSLPKLEAATVNIPPDGTNIEGADMYEVGMPLKPLPPGHELYFPMGGVVAVKNVAVFAEQIEGFTAADRALLRAIAAKLGA